MAIKSIETTPNPNSMKINLIHAVGGKPSTYNSKQLEGCPSDLASLLGIPGIQSIFVCNDFVTINRNPTVDWGGILDLASNCLTGSAPADSDTQRQTAEKDGQVNVFIQTFRGIPIQVKVIGTNEEKRLSLGSRFNEAAMRVQTELNANFLEERYWAEAGTRYGDPLVVAQEVTEEIIGVIDEKALQQLEMKALGKAPPGLVQASVTSWQQDLNSTEWNIRLRAVQEMGTRGTSEAVVPLLITALKDSHHQVRRLAAAALGASGSSESVKPLCDVLLHDASIGVKRTAGDALSDLGDSSAESAMCEALADSSKLVRWRAARFLAEAGTAKSLSSLQSALNDSEFEVRLEAESAIQRISGGEQGLVPAWKRIVDNG